MDIEFDKRSWWKNLDVTWKRIFKLSLDINHNPTDDELEKILRLEAIDCSGSYILSLEPLANLIHLRKLNCANTRIILLDKIKDLELLDELDCSNTEISSLEPVGNLSRLWSLNCSGSKIQTLKGIENLSALSFLNCSNTAIRDLEALKNLRNIRFVDCSNSKLENLKLEDFPESLEIKCQNTPFEQAVVDTNNSLIDYSDPDSLFEEAARLIVTHQQGSTSLLQRKLKLGYNRVGRIIDQLEHAGIVGPFEGSQAREVLIQDEATLEQLLLNLRKGQGTSSQRIPSVESSSANHSPTTEVKQPVRSTTSIKIKYVVLGSILIFFLSLMIRGLFKNTVDESGEITNSEMTNKPAIPQNRIQAEPQKPTEINPFIKKYAGSYVIKVIGYNQGPDELMDLKLNGECIWSYNGQSKYGSWTADVGVIKTTVRGNTGDIPEDFVFRNGNFVSTDSDKRYLRRK